MSIQTSVPNEELGGRATLGWKYFLALNALVWTTYGVVHFAASIPAIDPDERVAIAISKAVRAVTAFAITCGIWPILRSRLNPESARWWITVTLTAFAAGTAWMFIDRVLLVTVASAFRITIPWARFQHGLDLDYFFVMLAWTAGVAGLLLVERSRIQREEIMRQELEHQSTRLRLLASQLNPHFLFNSLNTIRSLAAEDSDRTREVVTRLSSFLRRVISFDAAVPTTVAEEMALGSDYLQVEEARFESGLDVSIDMAPDTETVLVPPLIVQPLLENAIVHGEVGEDGKRRVGVTARMNGNALVIAVSNIGAMETRTSERGLGLQLTRSRLEQMYGAHQRLEASNGDGVVIVSVVIDSPLRADSFGAAQ